MALLSEKNIGTRPFFYPMHLQPVLQKMGYFRGEAYPVSEGMYQQGFYLPSGLAITQHQIEQVADRVRAIYEVYC